MIYGYYCSNCDRSVEIIKSLAEYDHKESCARCGQEMTRKVYSPSLLIKPTFQANYNPAFGKVIYSKKEQEKIVKEKGLIEIGNENIDKVENKLNKEKEERINREWDNIKIEGL